MKKLTEQEILMSEIYALLRRLTKEELQCVLQFCRGIVI